MLWYAFRLRLARWWPFPDRGVGIATSDEPMCSGELPLTLDVEGRTGTVYLSRGMWYAIAREAGWVTDEEADLVWHEEEQRNKGA